MPKVLFLTGLQLHPTMSGGTLRSFALASGLTHHGWDVRVHALTARKADYLARRASSAQVWPGGTEEHVDRGLSSAFAWLAGYVVGLPPWWLTARLAVGAASRSMLLPRGVREKLRWCDVVVADSPFVSPILSAPEARGKLRVLNTHNVEHRVFDDGGWRKRPLRAGVRALEIRAAKASDIVVSCCEDDARFFEENADVRRGVVVVPNAIDPRRFEGIEALRPAARLELGIPEDVTLCLFTASKWRPNRDAYEYLRAFAQAEAPRLAEQGLHILVVGNVVPEPVRLPGFTATGGVPRMEPYFAAADVALNPIVSGAGTNVKMCEFLALRLPIVTTAFGARGFRIEDGATGFLFEPDGLAPVLARVRQLSRQEPERLRQMTRAAYAQNEDVVDMTACVRRLVDVMNEALLRPRPSARPSYAVPAPPSD